MSVHPAPGDPSYPPPPPANYGQPQQFGQPQQYGQQPQYGGYGQPPPPYGGAPAPGGHTTVIVTQPTATNTHAIHHSPHPVTLTCPHCGATVTTSTKTTPGSMTWMACCILWLVGLGWGCCLIPFCMESCQDVVHSCPNCKANIGRYNRR